MSKSISIIIPFYNGESFYPNLLNSIKKAISVCDSAKTEFEIITIIDSIETKFDIVNELFLKCFKSDVNVTSLIIKNEKNIVPSVWSLWYITGMVYVFKSNTNSFG